jgi:hypothetical protein
MANSKKNIKSVSEILAAIKAESKTGSSVPKVDRLIEMIKADPSAKGLVLDTAGIRALCAAAGFANEQPGEARDNPELIRLGKAMHKKGAVVELSHEKGADWKWEIL